MAEGLILQSSAEVQPENLGNQYFRDLLSRGFFQQSITSGHSKFLMHALFHDLAQSVSKTTIRSEEGKHQLISNKVRHAAYGENEFADFHKFENLRTFIPLAMLEYGRNYISSMVLVDLLPKFKKLRVLSLARSYISHLPDSIGGMRHLRYLNVSYTKLESVPESISLLFKLQILILRNCYLLKVLPSNMRNLVNLRYLDISETSLKEMPLGMRELKELRMLSNFIVGKNNGSNLEDLRNLEFLQGELCISELSNILESKAPKEKIIRGHKDLKVLSLDWSNNLVDSSPYDEVLDMLQPHINLEELTIKYYHGARFPSWLGNQLPKMVVLNLENCIKCETLPCLGLLGSLEKLSVKGMRSLKYFGFEIYGDCLEPFKSLKTLYFENLQEWETWEPNQENERVKLFSCLHELSIVECPKLTGKLPEDLPSLETLVIRKCAELMVSFTSFPSLSNLEIDDCRGIEYGGSPLDLEKLNSMSLSKVSGMRNWLKQGFYQVKSLIVDSEELIYLLQNMTCVQKPLQTIQSFTFLEELCIDNCTSVDMFPGSNFLPNLSYLKIWNCKALKSLPDGVLHNNTSVERLEIQGCDSLTFIVRGMLPLSLKRLEIRNCEKLQCLVDDKEDICTSSSSSSFVSVMRNSLLESLSVDGCPSLTCISTRGQLPMSLKSLEISDCPKLESITERFDYNTCLKDIDLHFCERNSLLESLSVDGCPSLTCISTRGQLPMSLKSLEIFDCPKLESITERFDYNTCLKDIDLHFCENLKSIPEGLHNLRCLESITLRGCSSVVSLPEEGLPNSIVRVTIFDCEKLEALPDRMHDLHSLKTLEIRNCRKMASFPAEGLPTKMTRLIISGDLKIFKSPIEWALHNLTSLKDLHIYDCEDAVCFSQEEMRMRLPTSLISLQICKFPNLKYLSPTVFQGLNSLSTFRIRRCPELTSLSKVELPSSLFKLEIRSCPLLKIQRKGDKGKKWSNIAHIPIVMMDDIYI